MSKVKRLRSLLSQDAGRRNHRRQPRELSDLNIEFPYPKSSQYDQISFRKFKFSRVPLF